MTVDMRAVAAARHQLHANHASSRPLSRDYELVGLRGEEALCREFGGAVDITVRPGGDGGRDLTIKIWGYVDGIKRVVPVKLDVKAARKPFNLIAEQGKVKQNNIYVLARYDDALDEAFLLGWEWGDVVAAAPAKDFGYGITNHFIPRGRIHAIERLKKRCLQ